MIQKAITIDIF